MSASLNTSFTRTISNNSYEHGVGLFESEALSRTESQEALLKECLTIIVIGASGDLSKKKTFPALFSLWKHGLLPVQTTIVGYARSALSIEDFKSKVSSHLKGDRESIEQFLEICHYQKGSYTAAEDFAQLHVRCTHLEKLFKHAVTHNRIFYFAIPPSIFVDVSRGVSAAALGKSGFNRIVVEKPFGKDLESSRKLSVDLKNCFEEDMLYRIDHYLGKEMVQNLVVLRFANGVFEPLWNRHHINTVQITFKEPIGVEGRGGYFDQYGIIRDVMQNHLTQILSLVAMEPPVSLHAEDVRDEKVKALRSCQPLQLEHLVIGQYPEYTEDEGVPNDSNTETFAVAVLFIRNARWDGVPFIMKCGKGLNERKAEVRVQFKKPPGNLFQSAPNELVMRVQPDEAVYLKMTAKEPGLSNETKQAELDLSYHQRFEEASKLPEAYERLIWDVVRGDHNLFVRDDELDAAWQIFTPALHAIANRDITPYKYTFGSRGPEEADSLAKNFGYKRVEGYEWPGPRASL